jgi:hypothetical protein
MRRLRKNGRMTTKDFLKDFDTDERLSLAGAMIECGWINVTVNMSVEPDAEQMREFCWIETLKAYRQSTEYFVFLKAEGLEFLVSSDDQVRTRWISFILGIIAAVLTEGILKISF